VAPPARSRLGIYLAVAALAIAVTAIGALVWSRTVADGSDRETVRLDTPGEYALVGTNPPARGEPLPDLEYLDADGTVVSLTPGDGRPMVVNLWYSTCPPCARELRDFGAVHAEVGDEVRFVGVNPIDEPDEMTQFAAERGVTYELVRDPASALATELDVVAFPVTLFVDPDGTIVEQTGPIDAAELRSIIESVW
jgi:peroxiredoxin